jgi:hypothetical protein
MAAEATQGVQDHNSGRDNSSPADSGQDTSGPILKIGSTSIPLATAEAHCRRGAAVFYWIAGLSLINMIALAGHWDFSMVVGLGVTEILQAAAIVAGKAEEPGVMVGLYAATLAVIALFAVFGWRARQIERWPFVLGMWLYAADSVIFVVFQDFFALGFHVFFLVILWFGLIWVRPVQSARRCLASAGGPDDAVDPEKMPEFLRAEKPATAPAPTASSSI